jgi:hypothetical protein
VHKDSRALDTILHTLTAAVIADMSEIHIVGLASVPNASWLRPGMPGTG